MLKTGYRKLILFLGLFTAIILITLLSYYMLSESSEVFDGVLI